MAEVRVAAMFFGIEGLFGGDLQKIVEAARIAEEAGIDQVVLFDHVVMGERTDRYPYGEFPVPPDYPWLEPITTMAAIAGATSRIRLSTGVLISPLRPAVLLAKMAATLDLLSGGRLDLGVGTGWQREEYQASGIPFRGRTARLDDQLRACRVLWRDSPASFSSETVTFQKIWCRPAPLQPGGIPLWFGVAPTEDSARRIAELGEGWVPISPDPAFIAEGVARIRRAFEAAGRDPATLRVRAQLQIATDDGGRPDLERSLATLDQTLEAGATDIAVVPGTYIRSHRELRPFFERLVRIR
jgi:probable F420-dependent oxidoreductase